MSGTAGKANKLKYYPDNLHSMGVARQFVTGTFKGNEDLEWENLLLFLSCLTLATFPTSALELVN